MQTLTENELDIKPNTNPFNQPNDNLESLSDTNMNAKHVEMRTMSEKTNTTQEKPTRQEGDDPTLTLDKKEII